MSGEAAPLPAERLQAVADWVATKVRPVLHVMAEGAPEDEPQQEFETREYQLDAWARLEDARADGRMRVLGNLATGLGKTFVAGVDVMRYREWCAQQDPPMIPRVLYVSHQRDINEQAAETFRALMPDAEITHFETKKKQLPDADITFATIQGLYSELDRFDPQDYEYIIWDESHHLEAETYKAVRDHFDPLFEHAITATIERMDGKDIQEYFGSPLYQKRLAEGIAEGWLADVDYHIVFDRAVRSKLQGGFDPKSLREIKELFDEKPPLEAIARSIEEEIERIGLDNPKTIFFCEDIEEAEAMAELLGGVAYHSQTDNRKQTLQDFRTGALRRIMTRDMFNEGVNIPDAELIVFLRSTNSPAIFEQQLGRGLRRAAGKDKVYVLDFVANVERIAKVRELSQAIQRRAAEINGRDGGRKGPIPGEESSEGGLQVHTAHGDFDFDKIAVDLLEKWGRLNSDRVETAEAFRSIYQAAQDLGVARDTLTKLCDQHGIVPKQRMFKTSVGYGIDQTQYQTLWDILHSEEDTVYGIQALAAELGLGPRTVKEMAAKIGIEPQRRSIKGSKLSLTITGPQLIEIKAQFPDAFLEKAPAGNQTITAVAKGLGVDFGTIKGVVERAGWGLQRYKFPTGAFETLNPTQIAEVSRQLSQGIPLAPEGATTLKRLAGELGTSVSTLQSISRDSGVTTGQFRFGRQIAEGLLKDEVLIVTEAFVREAMPASYLSVSEAAKLLGVSDSTVMQQVKDYGWTLEKYRARTAGGRSYALSSEQLALLESSERIQEIRRRKSGS